MGCPQEQSHPQKARRPPLTHLPRLEGLDSSGPHGLGMGSRRNYSPSEVPQIMWKRPRETTESSSNLSFTKGNNQLGDGQPGPHSQKECRG